MVEHLGQYDSGVSYKKVIFWFLGAAAVISLAALYFVLSRVTISLIPKVETKELELEVALDPEAQNINLENNTLRGILLTEESTAQKSITDIPPKRLEENATGKITVHNGYTRAQGFKEGDILVTISGDPPQKVRVTKNVIVYRTQTKDIEVAAVEKGIAGHIPPSTFKFEKYDDFMNEKVTAESSEALSGGIRTATLVTENDINTVKGDLLKTASSQNLEKLKQRLRPGEELNTQSIDNTIVAFHSSVAAPFETDNFKADIAVKSVAPVFKREDLTELINTKLRTLAQDNQELLSHDPDSLSYTIKKIDPETKKATLNIKIKGSFRPKLSTQLFAKDEIKGYNERALRAHYERFEDLEGIDVKFFPRFRKTVPEMDSRIIIEIKE